MEDDRVPLLREMAPQMVHLDLHADGVAVITLDRPPVNALTVPLLEQFVSVFEEARRMPGAKAIVIHGANGRFSAGMDLVEVFAPMARGFSGFNALLERRDRFVSCLNSAVEAGSLPTVAAVERVALGGGLEIAMACNAIVATPDAVMGLPELSFGIVPDFGGMARSVRLLPPERAISMLLRSETVTGREAADLGLVDETSSTENLLEAAKRAALEMADGGRPRRRALADPPVEGWREEALRAVEEARKKDAPLWISQMAADFALDCVARGAADGPAAGEDMSRAANAVLSRQPPHRAAVRAFAARHAARHARGLRGAVLSLWARFLAMIALAAAVGSHLARRNAGHRRRPLRSPALPY